MTSHTSKSMRAGLLRGPRAGLAALSGLCLLFVAAQATAGQNANNNPTNNEVLISEVYVDFDAGEIVISGVNFDNGATPEVRLGGDPAPLALISNTATEIVAELPAIDDGDYLLSVATGTAVKDYDEYDLTIGAVGPAGPPGPPGPPGAQGESGIATCNWVG